MKNIYTKLKLTFVLMGILLFASGYGQQACPANLLHYWSFDQKVSGEFVDQIGNLNADILVTTSSIAGVLDSGQFFNGFSEVNIPDSEGFDWDADGSFTIEFWINKFSPCPDNTTSNNNVIIGRDDPATNLHWWAGVSCSTPGKINFTLMANDGNGITLQSKKGVIDGTWHLISIVRDGSEQSTSIFIDGELDTTANYTYSEGFSSNAPINVGWFNTGPRYRFNGFLDELAIYNSALTESEFLTHFNSGDGKSYCETDSGDDTFYIAVDFSGMTPNQGQNLFVYLINSDEDTSIDSISLNPVNEDAFSVVFDNITENGNYWIDIWADLNANGQYNVPPEDHAWRIELPNQESDTTIQFIHNFNFTDIFDMDTLITDTNNYQLTVNFSGFEDNIGQNLTVFLRDTNTQEFLDSLVTLIDSSDFTIVFDSVIINNGYNIDFYADVNGNGTYDIPPLDHAWRVELDNFTADTTIIFNYDTNFEDIGLIATGIDDFSGESHLGIFPNPVINELNIQLQKSTKELIIYDLSGSLVKQKSLSNAERFIKINVADLKAGLYILKLVSESGSHQQKFIKE